MKSRRLGSSLWLVYGYFESRQFYPRRQRVSFFKHEQPTAADVASVRKSLRKYGGAEGPSHPRVYIREYVGKRPRGTR